MNKLLFTVLDRLIELSQHLLSDESVPSITRLSGYHALIFHLTFSFSYLLTSLPPPPLFPFLSPLSLLIVPTYMYNKIMSGLPVALSDLFSGVILKFNLSPPSVQAHLT